MLVVEVLGVHNSPAIVRQLYPGTISGGSLTYSQRVYDTSPGTYRAHGSIWTAVCGGSPGTFSITITAAETQSNTEGFGTYSYAIWQETGFDTGTPTGGVLADYLADSSALTGVLGVAPATGDITPALAGPDETPGSYSGAGASFGSTYGTWTVDGPTGTATRAMAFAAAQRTASTSANVQVERIMPPP